MTVTYPLCPVHGEPLVLRDSRFGPFLGCRCWPACDVTHGVHRKTLLPLGVPGTAADRGARICAHAAFDLLWKTGVMSRRDAYRWLAYYMGLREDECHVGRFTAAQCAEVVQLVELWRKDGA